MTLFETKITVNGHLHRQLVNFSLFAWAFLMQVNIFNAIQLIASIVEDLLCQWT